jgi:hypothetical protein
MVVFENSLAVEGGLMKADFLYASAGKSTPAGVH